MYRRIRMRSLLAALTFGWGMLLAAPPAQAQGPYGRNSYEDWPYNQGGLFYRPLKPKPRPKARPRVVARPATRPGTVQPQYFYQNGRYYYYYPMAPAAPAPPTAGH